MTKSALRGANVLVTGATGLVGGALVRLLESEGADVTTVERESATRRATGIVVPSYSPTVVRDALDGIRADYVFHLGAYGVKPHENDPLAMVEGNKGVTAAVLDAVARSPPRLVVFAASCAQYAPIAAPGRLNEDAAMVPTSPYGAAKLAAEHSGRVLAKKHGMPFVSLRLFGVYGPGESPHRLIPYLARALARGQRPDLTGGEQVRDWIYVNDVARALVTAATAPTLDHDAYNVCSGSGIAVRDVVREVGRVMSAGAGMNDDTLGLGRRPYRPDEAMWMVGDPTRFGAATGWSASTPIEAGVRRTVEWATATLEPQEVM